MSGGLNLVALEEALDGGATACDPMLVRHTDHLIQRQIRLLFDQRQQPLRMFVQRRGAPATRLGYATPSLVKALDPFDRCTWADIEQFGCLASRGPAFDARNHSFPNTPPAWFNPQRRINAGQTLPFAGPWESCDSIRPEHALAVPRGHGLRPCSKSCA